MIFDPPQVRLRLEDIKSLIQAWQPGNLIEITGGFLYFCFIFGDKTPQQGIENVRKLKNTTFV